MAAAGERRGPDTAAAEDTGPDGADAGGTPEIAAALLAWYGGARRDLPWRTAPGVQADAYRVWLSEVMLQQTAVKAAAPFFLAFLARWPTVMDLAAASEDDVLAMWSGLGYYARARNLLRCARTVAACHGGRFPETETELRRLPGIGPYTAAAIAAIAFGKPAAAVDGNVERVVSRLFAVAAPLPRSRPRLRALASRLVPERRAGDFAQALMDLGATVCTVRRPSCLMCPLKGRCAARACGLETTLPVREARPERPVRRGVAFLAVREDGCILLRRRPSQGLLAGMLEVPSTEWTAAAVDEQEALRTAPVRAGWWPVPGTVLHAFTHFRLELSVCRAAVPPEAPLTFWAEPRRCLWLSRHDLARAALPGVMRKVIRHGLSGL